MQNPTLNAAEIKLDVWMTWYRRFTWLHYGLGVCGVVFSAITAAKLPYLNSTHSPYLFDTVAWAATVCVSLLTLFSPSKKASAYLTAWHILDNARNRYLNDEQYGMDHILDAMEKGDRAVIDASNV